MKRVLRCLAGAGMAVASAVKRVWLRMEIANVEHAIAYEEARQRSHDDRMRYWQWQRAVLCGRLRALNGRHGAVNTSTLLSGLQEPHA